MKPWHPLFLLFLLFSVVSIRIFFVSLLLPQSVLSFAFPLPSLLSLSLSLPLSLSLCFLLPPPPSACTLPPRQKHAPGCLAPARPWFAMNYARPSSRRFVLFLAHDFSSSPLNGYLNPTHHHFGFSPDDGWAPAETSRCIKPLISAAPAIFCIWDHMLLPGIYHIFNNYLCIFCKALLYFTTIFYFELLLVSRHNPRHNRIKNIDAF